MPPSYPVRLTWPGGARASLPTLGSVFALVLLLAACSVRQGDGATPPAFDPGDASTRDDTVSSDGPTTYARDASSDPRAAAEAAAGSTMPVSDSGASVADAAGSTPVPLAFVHTRGTRLLDERDNDLYLRGINLGNWLVWEGYLMTGDFSFRTHSQLFAGFAAAFGSGERAAAFEYAWRLHYVDERAIADLSGLGFNAVRVPFHHTLFWSGGQLRDDGFEFFDRVIEACRAHGMYVLLDMHGAPGYQNPGDHSGNEDSNLSQPRASVRFWDGENIRVAATIWRHIAARYKDEPVVLGYDLLNEPVPQEGREYEHLPSYVTIRDAVRSVDPNHVIVAEGSWWGSDLSKLDWEDPTVRQRSNISAAWDDNLVYELHHYGPAADTFGREAVTQRLNVPLILGEYGETDENNLRATTDWAQSVLVGSFPWSFKKVLLDRALWTVPSNADYDAIRAFIVRGGPAPSDRFDAALAFARRNTRNGHPGMAWHPSFYDAIKLR